MYKFLPSTTSSAPQPESSSTVESSSTKRSGKVHQVLVQKVRLLPLKRHHQPNNRQALPQQSNRQHRNNRLDPSSSEFTRTAATT